MPHKSPTPLICPHPLARAPRATNPAPLERLHLPPAALHGAFIALISRDTRGVHLSDAQRLTHFPATPVVALSWFSGMQGGLIELPPNGEQGPLWQPFATPMLLSGSRLQPCVGWGVPSAVGTSWRSLLLSADVASALLGVDLGAVHDRFLPVAQALHPRWHRMCDALLHAPDDAAVMEVLLHHLAPPWQQLRGRMDAAPSLRQVGRAWVDRLAWRAQLWQRSSSPRHVERRVKAFSGRSLREWQAITRTEGVFFGARDRFDAGQHIQWADLAAEQGFADQAHLSRTVKRITGFSPSEFSTRFVEDESFWLYRLWV